VFVGHFAASLVAKRTAPAIPLGTLVFAAMLPDILWCLFMLAGFEWVRFGSGSGAGKYLAAWYVPFSHSLVMTCVWAAVLAIGCRGKTATPRAIAVLIALVVSHWCLDAISSSHMPIAPGMARTIGLGLWNSIPATVLVEGGAWSVALASYTHSTRAAKPRGEYAFWFGAFMLTMMWRNNIAGPAPSARSAAIGSLVAFSAAVAWAYWIDTVRVETSNSGAQA